MTDSEIYYPNNLTFNSFRPMRKPNFIYPIDVHPVDINSELDKLGAAELKKILHGPRAQDLIRECVRKFVISDLIPQIKKDPEGWINDQMD